MFKGNDKSALGQDYQHFISGWCKWKRRANKLLPRQSWHRGFSPLAKELIRGVTVNSVAPVL